MKAARTELVKLIHSRNRDKEQFDMNVEWIGNVGLTTGVSITNDAGAESELLFYLCRNSFFPWLLLCSSWMRDKLFAVCCEGW